MRSHLLLYINGNRHTVTGSDCFLSLSDFLRCRLALVGTKIVCSEGDCGSCTVLVGRPDEDRFEYRPVDSCILRMFQLDGTHIVTVEGLRRDDSLTPVQQAMVDCHGSQCGFCTPGFVVAMTGLLEQCDQPCEADWRDGLTGNLCRCTGYVPILEAGLEVDPATVTHINQLYPPQPMVDDLATAAEDSLGVETGGNGRVRRFFGPTSVDAAVEALGRHPQAKVVAGATDVGVQLNKGVIDPEVFVDLNRIADLEEVALEVDGTRDTLVAGARASWTEIQSACRDLVPEFCEIVSIFGSPQIRHVGTIGGNVINASPIADSLPFLFVTEAQLELQGPDGERKVGINDFYRGYKQFDLRPGELLARVRTPLPTADERLRLVKVSRRRDLDIATFTAAILLRLDGDAIGELRLALGAVGPTVIRARKTEAFLRGRPFDESTLRAAGDIAVSEISPISDVRGSAEYRYQLTRNVLLKFFHEQTLAVA